ncbi:TetR family transcriptional regulator C-terminal domain-containing protein [Lichenicoccus roseus]|uniref:TetR family transcriptional regulator n=1 Tax=Lichenicoccus roseus TaxID=2683649 RepID=A0A5R9IZ44_9PROT|nr:TetR family transcriptional regulator C-terminal domain-containing protein [Lichenicoccus roseus]TLU70735.1 TetR family transcriptional regulator [Lichenicoccus roseus]
MGRSSYREKILSAGISIAHERGFATSGVRDFVQAAAVPQGSFINNFGSKEAFGIAVLDRYFEGLDDIIGQTLRDEARGPIERLRSYFDTISASCEQAGWRLGCLIGNMSLEAPNHSDAIRERLVRIFADWKQPFAEAVRAAQACADLSADLDPDDVAEFLLAGWHGAMLRMKVDRSGEPLERFKRVVFATVLARPAFASTSTGKP